jgi:flavodoxin
MRESGDPAGITFKPSLGNRRIMNTLIIYKSYHRMNTEKVAQARAGVLNATLKKVDEIRPEELSGHDLIGIGAGISAGRYHTSLFRLVGNGPRLEKDVFVFSTAGGPQEKYDRPMKDLLISKGARIVGEFGCPGQAGFFGFTWPNRGHPDGNDLEAVRVFAQELIHS